MEFTYPIPNSAENPKKKGATFWRNLYGVDNTY